MCYSAQIWADYRRYVREFGALLDIKEFYDLFWRRKSDSKIKIPKAMETAFAEPVSDIEREIKALIGEFRAGQELKLQQELFKQKKRLADAERTLETKTTKKAEEDKRIASSKISWAMDKLSKNPDKRFLPKMLDYLEKRIHIPESKGESAIYHDLRLTSVRYIEKVTGRSMGLRNIMNFEGLYDEKELAAAIAAIRKAE